MSYIGFIDLLGTKSVAEWDALKYNKFINDFHEAVLTKANAIFKPAEGDSVYMFSDCAYIQTKNLNDLVNFYIELRLMLFVNTIYFQASLTEGELGVNCFSVNSSDIVKFMKFDSDDVVKAFSMQNSFKGIGVYIDPKLIEEHSGELENETVESIFQTNENTKENTVIYQDYHDLKYLKGTKESSTILNKILLSYTRAHLLNPSAARYYVSAIKSIIADFNIDDIFKNFELDNDEYSFTKSMEMIFGIDDEYKHYRSDIYNLTHSIALNRIIEVIVTNGEEFEGSVTKLKPIFKILFADSRFKYLYNNIYKIQDNVISKKGKHFIVNYLVEAGYIFS